ncbi:hypothetical protein KMW28_03705 [Flammeovirga yaeyamensis]|uniref:Lipoprotein n=1 Tax=Flammeovirga yaeyamensis TaxID=367791 RepID=A0AAX1N552_9BACT|nr:hypothetical protein [Flammeovirga yaeyamensis]MBB3701247.1 hypothetical protein [Flammeovirga yaeyamensis]NMF38282.1 hypothetical protein [Flammeovirga yaeyamensis]QWG02694.1 hypothetical protein KMW28_03705 [Flammeovirga yaeyamensis]
MLEKLKKNLTAIIVVSLIGLVATCNIMVRKSDREKWTNNPKPGYYYVFDDFPIQNEESIMKIKEVKDQAVIFYLPKMKTIGSYKLDKTDSKVKDLDKQGVMYGSETITIDKADLLQMVEDDTFSGHMNHKPRVTNVFL